MSRMAMRARSAFSLLEIIIATAILAGSAMVLFSLIGLGTKYGSRAEEQTLALSQAQSVLDEYIVRLSEGELQEGVSPEGVSGVLNGVPARSYRIEILPVDLAGNSGASRNSSTPSETRSVLVKVTVTIFNGNGSLPGMESEPLCQLTCLVRRPRLDEPLSEPLSEPMSEPLGEPMRAVYRNVPSQGGRPKAIAIGVRSVAKETSDSHALRISRRATQLSVRFHAASQLSRNVGEES